MSIFKRPLVAMLVIIACSSVSTAFAETTDATPSEHESHHTESQRDWSGLYQGFLPCVDCKGIKTMLALNPNNSYILITQHVGKSDREITEKGKFAWDEATNTIILTPRNSTETHSYLMENNALVHLDSKGERITGKLAEHYVLHKTAMTEQKHSAAHH